MLGKLFKYDLKAVIAYYLMIWGAVLGTAALLRISVSLSDFSSPFQDQMLIGMGTVGSMLLYGAACCACVILALFLTAMRFYKNLMGNEGYLSFTLPVTVNAHLVSKLLSAVFYLVLTYGVLLLSGVIISAGTGLWDSPFGSVLEWIVETVIFYNPLVTLLYVLKTAAFLLETVLVIYFSVCVGQLASKHRVLGAIGIYLAVNAAVGIFTILGSAVLVRLLSGREGTALYYGVTYGTELLFYLLLCVGCYAGSYGLLRRRLNLE